MIGPRFFLRVWCRGAAAPTPEQTSDTAGDGFSKIQQAGVRSALAPRMALAQGRTGSRGAHSATRRHATWSQTMRARSQHGSRRLGRRSFPIMFFRRALKHLLSMTNGYDDTPVRTARAAPRARSAARTDAGRLCATFLTRPSNDKLGVSKKGLSPLDLPPGLIRTVLSSREPLRAQISRPAPQNRYRDAAPLPGFFWLFAIGELVSNKPCVILAASWWVSGEGQCRDETR